MQRLSDKISIIPVGCISTQYKNSIILSDESKIFSFLSSSEISFSQEEVTSPSGLKYDISHESVCKQSEIMRYNNTLVVAKLYCMDDTIRFIGTKSSPARIIVTPYQGGLYRVKVSASLPFPVF